METKKKTAIKVKASAPSTNKSAKVVSKASASTKVSRQKDKSVLKNEEKVTSLAKSVVVKSMKPAKGLELEKASEKTSLNEKTPDSKNPPSQPTGVKKVAKNKASILEAPGSITPYALQNSEEYMSDSQLNHFKDILKTWRVGLLNKLDTTVSQLKDEPKHFADLNERATQEEEFNLELRARDREADLVARIDEALRRVNEGDYGYCSECGVEIGLRRLEARPTATLCIDCKTLAEMRERQSGSTLPL